MAEQATLSKKKDPEDLKDKVERLCGVSSEERGDNYEKGESNDGIVEDEKIVEKETEEDEEKDRVTKDEETDSEKEEGENENEAGTTSKLPEFSPSLCEYQDYWV